MNALARLKRFAAGEKKEERCALCSASIGERHPHVVDTASAKVPVNPLPLSKRSARSS